MRYVRERTSGFYFEPSKAMVAAGICPQALGKDPVVAVTRAQALLDDWDALRAGRAQERPPRYPEGTLGALDAALRRTAEWRDKSGATRDEYDYAWARLIEPDLGRVSLRDGMTAAVCEAFYGKLRETGSIHRAARAMKWLRYLLNRAVRLGAIGSNPALAVRVKTPRPRRVVWTEEQIRAVAAAARSLGSPDLEAMILVAYDTGIRAVDLRGLRWGDLGHDELSFVQAKTGRPVETVIYPETVAALARPRALHGADPMPHAYLFRSSRGRPWSKGYLSRRFREARREAGLPDSLQLRDIRRTAETERQEAGATEAEAAAAAGHSLKRAGQLRDVYTVTNARMARAAQDKRLLAKRRNTKRTSDT